MISEEDKALIEEARELPDDCLLWHHHCHAECCKRIWLNLPLKFLLTPKKYIEVRQALTKDMVWYYRLHGVRYHHGILKFPKENCTVLGMNLVYVRKCALLMDNCKCKGHPIDKPLICQKLTLDTASTIKGARVTENCLYKYKLMGMQENENENNK